MKLSKPSPGLIAEFRAALEQLPMCQPRKMFGYDAAFVNGNMAVGLWKNTCVVKVSAADQSKLLERGLGVPFAPMAGRVMTGWIELSEELAHDPEELLAWSTRAVQHAATLPPKPKASKQRRASKQPSKKPPAKGLRTSSKKAAVERTRGKQVKSAKG